METGCEKTFHSVADSFVFEERPISFELGFTASSISDQILVHNTFTGIPFHVKSAMDKPVFETVATQREGVDTCLSAALGPFIDRFVKKVVNAPRTIAHIKEAVTITGYLSHLRPHSSRRYKASAWTRDQKSKNAANNISRLKWSSTSLPFRSRRKLAVCNPWIFPTKLEQTW